MRDAETLRSALRTLVDEAEWVRTEYAQWCQSHGASPRRVREALYAYVNERSASEQRGSRLGRRLTIIKLCDLEGQPHKVAASALGLSRAQFYRERRLAIDHLANEMRRTMEDVAAELHEGTVHELLELHQVLKAANTAGNRVIASLVAKTRSAILAMKEEHHGAIAF